MFDPPPTYQHTRGLLGPLYFPGDAEFLGENRPAGALLSYMVSDSLAEAVSGDGGMGGSGGPGGFGAFFGGGGTPAGSGPVTIEILQADTVVRSFKGPAEAGMNRVNWQLDRKGLPALDADEDDPQPSGPQVLPGTYGVRITVGDHSSEGTVEVRPDPRRPRNDDVVRANLEVFWMAQPKVLEVQDAIRRLNEAMETLNFYEGELGDWDASDEVVEALSEETTEMKDRVNGLLDQLRLPPGEGIRADTTLTSRLGQALGEATGTPYAPSEGRIQVLQWRMEEADELLADVEAFFMNELPEYREALDEAGFHPLGGG